MAKQASKALDKLKIAVDILRDAGVCQVADLLDSASPNLEAIVRDPIGVSSIAAATAQDIIYAAEEILWHESIGVARNAAHDVTVTCVLRGVDNVHDRTTMIMKLNEAFGRNVVQDVELSSRLYNSQRKLFPVTPDPKKRRRPPREKVRGRSRTLSPARTKTLSLATRNQQVTCRLMVPMTVEVDIAYYVTSVTSSFDCGAPTVGLREVQYVFIYSATWNRMSLGILRLAFKAVLLRILDDTSGNIHQSDAETGSLQAPETLGTNSLFFREPRLSWIHFVLSVFISRSLDILVYHVASTLAAWLSSELMVNEMLGLKSFPCCLGDCVGTALAARVLYLPCLN